MASSKTSDRMTLRGAKSRAVVHVSLFYIALLLLLPLVFAQPAGYPVEIQVTNVLQHLDIKVIFVL